MKKEKKFADRPAIGENPRPLPHQQPMQSLPLTKEAKIHNGEKIASSTNGPGKTDQLHVKE